MNNHVTHQITECGKATEHTLGAPGNGSEHMMRTGYQRDWIGRHMHNTMAANSSASIEVLTKTCVVVLGSITELTLGYLGKHPEFNRPTTNFGRAQ